MTQICVSAAASQVICAISCAVTWIQEQRYDPPPPQPTRYVSLFVCRRSVWSRSFGECEDDGENEVCWFARVHIITCVQLPLGRLRRNLGIYRGLNVMKRSLYFNTHAAHVGYFKVDSNEKPNHQARVGNFWQNLLMRNPVCGNVPPSSPFSKLKVQKDCHQTVEYSSLI